MSDFNDLSGRLAQLAVYHAERAGYGGASAEYHARAENEPHARAEDGGAS